jgi:hypothetical protein
VIYAGLTPGILRPYLIALKDSSCWRSSVWGTCKEVKRVENETSEIKLRNDGASSSTQRHISHTMVGNQHEGETESITWYLASRILDLSSGGFVPMPSVLILYVAFPSVWSVSAFCLSIAEPYFSNQQLVNQQTPRTKLKSRRVSASNPPGGTGGGADRQVAV